MLLLNSKHVRNKWSKVHYTWRLTTINNGSKLILLVAPRADSLGSAVDQRTNSQSRDWRLHYKDFPKSYPSTMCQHCTVLISVLSSPIMKTLTLKYFLKMLGSHIFAKICLPPLNERGEAKLVTVQKEVEKSLSSLLAGPWSLSFVGEVHPGWDEAETKT